MAALALAAIFYLATTCDDVIVARCICITYSALVAFEFVLNFYRPSVSDDSGFIHFIRECKKAELSLWRTKLFLKYDVLPENMDKDKKSKLKALKRGIAWKDKIPFLYRHLALTLTSFAALAFPIPLYIHSAAHIHKVQIFMSFVAFVLSRSVCALLAISRPLCIFFGCDEPILKSQWGKCTSYSDMLAAGDKTDGSKDQHCIKTRHQPKRLATVKRCC